MVSAVAVERGALTSRREKKVEFKFKYICHIVVAHPSTVYVYIYINIYFTRLVYTPPWTIGSSC